MQFPKSNLSLVLALSVLLLFVASINMVSTSLATALQDEGRFDPLDSKQEDKQEEEWDEEEEGDEGEQEDEEDWEDEDEEEDELEEMEMERLHVEMNIARLELIERLGSIADNQIAAASYAIMQLEEVNDDEQRTIELLEEMIEETRSPGVQNLLRMKLAEVYTWSDQQEKSIETLKKIILSAGTADESNND